MQRGSDSWGFPSGATKRMLFCFHFSPPATSVRVHPFIDRVPVRIAPTHIHPHTQSDCGRENENMLLQCVGVCGHQKGRHHLLTSGKDFPMFALGCRRHRHNDRVEIKHGRAGGIFQLKYSTHAGVLHHYTVTRSWGAQLTQRLSRFVCACVYECGR